MSKKHQQKVEVRTSVPFVISRRSQAGVPKVSVEKHGDHRVPKHKPRRPAVG